MNKHGIFRTYSKNLHLMVDNGLTKNIDLIYEQTYVCPVCLNQFNEESLNRKGPGSLTLEDVPQKALGGKAGILTCWSCNNHFGTKVDWHLIERLNELDVSKFLPNTQSMRRVVNNDGLEVNMYISVNEDRSISALSHNKHNAPGKIDMFNEAISREHGSRIMSVKNKKSKVELDRLKIAILKNAYLLMFQKFGYLFIYEQVYQRIRNQLLDPDTIIYPLEDWLVIPDKQVVLPGVYLVKEKDLYCFMIAQELKSQSSVKYVLAYLPLLFPIQYVTKGILFRQNGPPKSNFQRYFGFEIPAGDFVLSLTDISFMRTDLNDLKAIKQLLFQIS